MNETLVHTDYRYEVCNEEDYILPDGEGFVCLESAIEFALSNDGRIINKVWMFLDEDGEIIEDEPFDVEVVWEKE